MVNPKLNTNFVPKIEDVAYKYLGIEKPVERVRTLDLNAIEQPTFLPNLDLEQVSPESTKSPSMASIKSETNDDDDDKDDFESPPFELIQMKTEEVKEEIITNDHNVNNDAEIDDDDDDKMDICSNDSDDELNKPSELNPNDEVKSNLSSISGLTSNESIEEGDDGELKSETIEQSKAEDENVAANGPIQEVQENIEGVEIGEQEQSEVKSEETGEANESQKEQIEKTEDEVAVEPEPEIDEKKIVQEIQQFDASEQPEEKPSIHYSGEVENTNQDSVLSQVSSNSRLSIITNNNTATRADGNDEVNTSVEHSADAAAATAAKDTDCPFDISEEAQMQRFNESSSSSNGLVIDDNVSNEVVKTDENSTEAQVSSAFNIKRDEIKFEGTERKLSFDVDLNEVKTIEKTLKDEDLKAPSVKIDCANSMSSDVNKSTLASPSIDNGDRSQDQKIDANSCTEESNSSNSKSKDKRDLLKPKDRHGSSSTKDRHRSHGDKDKRHSSSHSSSRSSSSKHRHESSSSKGHHRSSSSLKKDTSKDKDREKDKEKERKSNSHRHSSSSSSHRDKDRKHDSKQTDRKHSHRSTSSSKKDDHESLKDKQPPRQRSRSKDSNDGTANSSNGSSSQPSLNEPASANGSQSSADTQRADNNANDQQKTSTQSSPVSQAMTCDELSSPNSPELIPIPSKYVVDGGDVEDDDEEFVMSTQPVVVDQILTSNELNLEQFIDVNRDDPIVSSMGESLNEHAKIKRPKVAANIHEARKLMKVRKQIDRDEQKKIEKAKVFAKQYMRTNANAIGDDSQGVELEFACENSGIGPRVNTPTTSSPVKFVNGTVDESSATVNTEPDFLGFTMDDYADAKQKLHNFNDGLAAKPKAKGNSKTPPKLGFEAKANLTTIDENDKLFLENNRIGERNEMIRSIGSSRKRKLTDTSIGSDEASGTAKITANPEEVANVVANVIISKTPTTSKSDPNRTGNSSMMSSHTRPKLTVLFLFHSE